MITKHQIKTSQLLIFSFFLFSLFFTHSVFASEQHYNYSPVDIDIVDDRGHVLNRYSVSTQKAHIKRAYLEATKNKHYQLRIRNNSNKRVGLVIAVDGRNILTGGKSYLKNNERMYVLGPYETSYYKGWRTNKNQINRFYFTTANNSYSNAWGDKSAMGVIAVAVFDEKRKYYKKHKQPLGKYSNPSARNYLDNQSAGTGFGEEVYSPTINVRFKANKSPTMKHFYKYEWRNTLCEKGIINCKNYDNHYEENRFWPYEANNGYAPYPPNIRNNRRWSDQFTRSWAYDYKNRGW